jgi:hypothetical protein
MQPSESGDRAPGNQAAPAASGPGQAAAAGPQAPAADDWAICCSGGGIRSAAYCLGALQSLDQRGLLAKVTWILGVSGGSYIATSRALVAHDLPAGTEPHAYVPVPRKSSTFVTTLATLRQTARRCWSASSRCSSGRWSRLFSCSPRYTRSAARLAGELWDQLGVRVMPGEDVREAVDGHPSW